MASVTEYLEKLQKLTQKNLDILQAINDAFYSNKSHLLVNVDGEKYTVPSFMHLENKLNALQDGFNNLVYAPKTGEASFNFDGNSQTIELRGFTCTPESVELKTPENFKVETNHIFKDFLTPNAYVSFDLSSIPNDISKVCVKKIAAVSQIMKDEFKSYPSTIKYEDLYKKLSLYTVNKDYIEYDTNRELPIRKSIGTGLYIIKSIDDHKILDDLTETYTISISGELKYKLFDNVIEKYLQIGDELVTYDDSAKLRILEVHHDTNQLVVEVLNGDYLNLVADTADDNYVNDMSKLKFYSSIDKNKDKYINVPLEEDQYIAIFVSPLNNRMNIRAPWGTGVVLDTYNLKFEDVEGVDYKNYYDSNICNIGDTLYELTTLSANGITKYTEEEFNVFTGYKPSLTDNKLQVLQINTHLNNSPTIQKIRSLYSQKTRYNRDLDDIQQNMDNINMTLSQISFDDTTNIRTVYESQLAELNKQRNEIISSINKTINEISIAANDSDIPIENAKFRIRGFYKILENGVIDKYKSHINGIRVWYRYKNQNHEVGNAQSIDGNLFSDWNEMPIIKRLKTPKYNASKYVFDYNMDNSTSNEPSFNQIDIPITQGEIVDLKLQVIWDFGYPFIETTSNWSDVLSVEFPEELKKDIQILDIIEENNSEIEKYRFTNILSDNGITTHVNDKLIDQDLTYFHQPEHVASGFYTAERRVIPLKDKLLNIDSDINTLKDEVFGYSANNISIKTIMSNVETQILPNQENIVYVADGVDYINLELMNNSTHTVKLYPTLIGSRGKYVYNCVDSDNNDTLDEYVELNDKAIPYSSMIYTRNYIIEPQRLNQFIYFRGIDAWTGNEINNINNEGKGRYMSAIPSIKEDFSLCINSDSKFDYLELRSQESISLTILLRNIKSLEKPDGTPQVYMDNDTKAQYVFDKYGNRFDVDFQIPFQFTLRTSLYNDPTSYEINFTTNNNSAISQIQMTQIDYNTLVK
jgi:hypothetical protein